MSKIIVSLSTSTWITLPAQNSTTGLNVCVPLPAAVRSTTADPAAVLSWIACPSTTDTRYSIPSVSPPTTVPPKAWFASYFTHWPVRSPCGAANRSVSPATSTFSSPYSLPPTTAVTPLTTPPNASIRCFSANNWSRKP